MTPEITAVVEYREQQCSPNSVRTLDSSLDEYSTMDNIWVTARRAGPHSVVKKQCPAIQSTESLCILLFLY